MNQTKYIYFIYDDTKKRNIENIVNMVLYTIKR